MEYEIKENINEKNLINNNLSLLDSLDTTLNEIYNEECMKEFKKEYDFFDEDNLLAQQIDYFDNYNMKMLNNIASYYKITKKRVKKEQLVQMIIQFENDVKNYEIVLKRKKCWHYLNELKKDDFFCKFVIFNF
jgi:hypothetical protein